MDGGEGGRGHGNERYKNEMQPERILSLGEPQIRQVLDCVFFEPGTWQREDERKEPPHIPYLERTHLTTPVGLLFNEIRCVIGVPVRFLLIGDGGQIRTARCGAPPAQAVGLGDRVGFRQVYADDRSDYSIRGTTAGSSRELFYFFHSAPRVGAEGGWGQWGHGAVVHTRAVL